MVTIAVTGSTGQLGGRVARRLGHSGHSSAGVAQRLLVRDLGRAPKLERATDAHSDRHVSVYGRRRPGLEGENPEIGRSMHESRLRRPDSVDA